SYQVCDNASQCRTAQVTVNVALLGRYKLLAGRTTTSPGSRPYVSMYADGTGVETPSPALGGDWVVVSPSGALVAETSGTSIAMRDITTGETKFAGSMPAPISRPTWSPDGAKLAFSAFDPQYGPALYEVDPPQLPGQLSEINPITYFLP